MPDIQRHPAVALVVGSADVSFLSITEQFLKPPNCATSQLQRPQPPVQFLQRYYAAPGANHASTKLPGGRWAPRNGRPFTKSGSAGLVQHLQNACQSTIFIMIPPLTINELPDHLIRDICEICHALRSLPDYIQSTHTRPLQVTLLVDGELPPSDLADYDAMFVATHCFQGAAALTAFRTTLSRLESDQPQVVWRGALCFAAHTSPQPQILHGFQLTELSRDGERLQHPLSAKQLRDLSGLSAEIVSASHALPVMGAFVDAYHAFNLVISSESPIITTAFCDQWRRSGVSLLLRIGTHRFWAFWHGTPSTCAVLFVPPLSSFAIRALDVFDYHKNFMCAPNRLAVSAVPEAVASLPVFEVSDLFPTSLRVQSGVVAQPNHPEPMGFDNAVGLLAERDVEQKRRKMADVQRRGSKRVRLEGTLDYNYPMATVEISLPEREELKAQDSTCKHDVSSARRHQNGDSFATGTVADKSFRSDLLSSGTLDTRKRRANALENNKMKQNRFCRLHSIKAVKPPSPRLEVPRPSNAVVRRRRPSDIASRAVAHEKHGKAVLRALEQSKKFFNHGTGNQSWENIASVYCTYGEDCDAEKVCPDTEDDMSSKVHGIEYSKDRDRRDGKIQSYERHVARSELEFCSFDDVFARTETNMEKLQGLFKQTEKVRAGCRSSLPKVGKKHPMEDLEHATLMTDGNFSVENDAQVVPGRKLPSIEQPSVLPVHVIEIKQ